MTSPYGYGPGSHPAQPSPYGAPDSQPQAPYAPAPYAPAPYAQAPYSQAPYAQAAYAQAPYTQAPYAQAAHAQPPHVQRPGVIGVSASMAITASLMWMVLLGFALLTAYSLRATFNTSDQVEGILYIMVDRFLIRMGQGLAFALFGFPLVATVAGFMLLARKPWARIVFSAVGVAALAWSAWWLRLHLVWWTPLVCYIALASLLPWIPAVGRWYADRPDATPGRADTTPQVPAGPVPPAESSSGTPNTPYSAPYGQFRP